MKAILAEVCGSWALLQREYRELNGLSMTCYAASIRKPESTPREWESLDTGPTANWVLQNRASIPLELRIAFAQCVVADGAVVVAINGETPDESPVALQLVDAESEMADALRNVIHREHDRVWTPAEAAATARDIAGVYARLQAACASAARKAANSLRRLNLRGIR